MPSGKLETFRVAPPAAAINFAHGLQAVTDKLGPTDAYTFKLLGRWREAPEASTGDSRSSPVNLPRLVLQRLDNGEVHVLPGHTFNIATGEFTGTLPGLQQGVWRAWAYVSGIPGWAAWFKVASRTKRGTTSVP